MLRSNYKVNYFIDFGFHFIFFSKDVKPKDSRYIKKTIYMQLLNFIYVYKVKSYKKS